MATLCVIAFPGDAAAMWAADGLRRAGVDVRCVSPVRLLAMPVFRHRLGKAAADDHVRFESTDGTRIDSRELRGVLQRVARLPVAEVVGNGPDAAYASAELAAAWRGWLASLGPRVLNPPTHDGLCGPAWEPSRWAQVAGRVPEVSVPDLHWSTSEPAPQEQRPRTRLIVLDAEQVFPAVPLPVARAARAIARASNTPLLGLDLAVGSRGVVYGGATPLPDLRVGGPALLDALSQRLEAA